uniref:Uncharacterized protein LOC111130923 n=1 Tax=Crassostrea virginica TaxID=6565 RepID=A0A8B8E3M7_CRAVI|nr:uncharacterized protein LOC111130923 [Crassostrea virginica]
MEMKICISLILLMIGLVSTTNISSNVTYLFPDNTCYLSSKPSHTNTSSLYVFGYNGRPISEDCQTISLHSADATLDKYRLCITPESFIDPNCSVTVEFRFSDTVMVFNCNTSELDTFCTNEETELTIKTMVVEGYQNANFTITVQNAISEIHTENFVTDSGRIVGIAVGGTVGVIVIGLVCFIYIRGKNSRNDYAYHSSNS